MNTVKIPDVYQQVMPYLIIKGATRFIEFMKKVFDAEVKMVVPREEGVIMHGEIAVGDAVIMFADATEEYTVQTAGMFIYVDDADKRYQSALDNGAVSVLAPVDQSYGRTCGVKDMCGNTWWITSI